MLTRSDSCWFPDLIADAAVQTVEEAGAAALTLPAVARRLGVTPQAVHKRTGGYRQMMDRILSVVAHRWLDAQASRWMSAVNQHAGEGLEGLVSMLPAGPPARTDLVVWLALLELGRADREEPDLLARVRREERELVAISVRRLMSSAAPSLSDDSATDPGEGAAEVTELVLALLYGLRTRLTDPAEALDPAQAERLLRLAVGRLFVRAGPSVARRSAVVDEGGADGGELAQPCYFF